MTAPVFPPGFGPQQPPAATSAPALPQAPITTSSSNVIEATSPPPSPVGSAGAGSGQSNTATLLMGPTGSGKSSLIATLSRYVYKKYGKVTLLASCDGGGVPMEIQKEIAVGRIRYWRMYTRDPGNRLNLAWDTMLKASQMWWPVEINEATGECPIGVALMPPMVTLFTMQCPNGHVVRQTTKAQELIAQICPYCNVLVNDINMKVQRVSRRPKFFEDVGAIAIEGLSSMCAWGEQDLGDRAARGDIEGMKGAIGGAVVSGDFTLGQVTMSHVGFIQQQARTLVLNSQGIPGLVLPPVFTALTLDATVEGTRVCGPQLSGRAKTDVAPAWFGNCLEAEKREVGGRYQFRLWLNQWRESTGVIHLCKNRASPGVLPDFLEDAPLTGTMSDQQTAFQQFSLARFFEMLDAALNKGIEAELAATGGKGVENRIVKYEDPFADQAVQVQQVQVPVQSGPPGMALPPAAAVMPAPPPTVAPPIAAPPVLLQPQAAQTVAPPPGRRPMAPPAAAPIQPTPPATTT